jgi:hypothetical protein
MTTMILLFGNLSWHYTQSTDQRSGYISHPEITARWKGETPSIWLRAEGSRSSVLITHHKMRGFSWVDQTYFASRNMVHVYTPDVFVFQRTTCNFEHDINILWAVSGAIGFLLIRNQNGWWIVVTLGNLSRSTLEESQPSIVTLRSEFDRAERDCGSSRFRSCLYHY